MIPEVIQKKIDERVIAYRQLGLSSGVSDKSIEIVTQAFKDTLLDGYSLAQQEIERLKELLERRDKNWHIVFYRATSTMTAREIDNFWQENWNRFKTENNL